MLRGFLFVTLAAATVVAYLVRQRSVDEGENYSDAMRALVGEVTAASKEATEQVRQAVEDGRLAARRREEAVVQDLAAADPS